jgi:predicted metallo-beta-lactamase superfamily hydrolase
MPEMQEARREELIDRVVERAFELAVMESREPILRRVGRMFRGGYQEHMIEELKRLAEGDAGVLVIAHHREWQKHHDPVGRRAVDLIQEARSRMIESGADQAS